jgi:hypothetical protein
VSILLILLLYIACHITILGLDEFQKNLCVVLSIEKYLNKAIYHPISQELMDLRYVISLNLQLFFLLFLGLKLLEDWVHRVIHLMFLQRHSKTVLGNWNWK